MYEKTEDHFNRLIYRFKKTFIITKTHSNSSTHAHVQQNITKFGERIKNVDLSECVSTYMTIRLMQADRVMG